MQAWFQARFAISTCTARYGRYIPVRQVRKKKKRGRKNTSPACRRCPRSPAHRRARGSPVRGRRQQVARDRFFSCARRRSVSSHGETDRGNIGAFQFMVSQDHG
ncbi:hypothetical protein GW17_00023580 [Ensete ventricosum]|nr:hypothetical protein GW17_00023580 [Ensete ventricosum]